MAGGEARATAETADPADEGDDPVADQTGIRTGPWSSAAVRGLVVVTALAVGLAGYLMWQAQPRSVAPVPEVIAVGDPITGDPGSNALAPASSPSPEGPVLPQVVDVIPTPGTEAPSADVIVHVAGQVARPGLVRLPGGSRVADAVEAAGGVTKPRAAETVNLARLVIDGEQIYVGGTGGSGGASAAGSGPEAAVAAPPLDLNSASVEQFDALPGVGPVIAGRIVEWRSVHGRFRSVEELAEVSGIGEAILASLRPLVRV